ncbi:hypothetical protein C2E23DRAFT_859282 [Lenzites betulinus]|nr:hypothetical protein C2E23DRAFT_859282 [Lenzites betulinus]
MSAPCTGTDSFADPCICTKFVKRARRKGKKRSLRCGDCGHSQQCHQHTLESDSSPQESVATGSTPQAAHTIDAIIARASAVAGPSITTVSHGVTRGYTQKASEDEARKEILQGFRPTTAAAKSGQKASVTSNKPTGRRGKGKQSSREKATRTTWVGSVLIHPGGLLKIGHGKDQVFQLCNKQYPSVTFEEELRRFGLFMTKDPKGEQLSFSEDWNTKAIDWWLRTLAGNLFEYLDAVYGVCDGLNGEVHWAIMRLLQHTLPSYIYHNIPRAITEVQAGMHLFGPKRRLGIATSAKHDTISEDEREASGSSASKHSAGSDSSSASGSSGLLSLSKSPGPHIKGG